jgi:uncharacterized membrane protein
MRRRHSYSDRRVVALVLLGGLSTLVVGLVAFRVAYTHTVENTNLVWNLFLAWIPLVVALVLYDRHARRSGVPILVSLGLVWLLFLPNAPYIVTDLRYLAGTTGRAFWFDGVLIGAAATTGLLLGFVSLYLLHDVVRRRLGARRAWVFALGVLGLSSLGVYLGRVLRWNSWDVVTRPGSRAASLGKALVDPFAHPHPIATSLLFATFLVVGYVVFYSVANAGSLLADQ